MIWIDARAMTRMFRHAGGCYPKQECCGMMIGVAGSAGHTVTRIVEAANVSSEDRRTHFEIDPAWLFTVHQDSILRGVRILGVYHSHCGGNADLSVDDLKGAPFNFCHFVMVPRGGSSWGARWWSPHSDGRQFRLDTWLPSNLE